MIRWAQVNEKIGEYVIENNKDRYASTAVAAHERLTEEYQNSPVNSYLQRIVIGNNTNRFIQVVPTVYSTSNNLALSVPKQPYFYTQVNTNSFDLSTGFMKDPFYSGVSPLILPIIRPIYAQYDSSRTGWVLVQISEKLFTTPLRYYSCSEDAGLYLVLGNHLYSLAEKGVQPLDIDYDIQYEIKNADLAEQSHAYLIKNKDTGKDSIILVRNLSTKGGYVIQTLSHKELQNEYRILFLLWGITFLLMLIIGLLLTYVLHRLIAVPVDQIKHQISEVSQGHFTPDTSIEWNHELGDIGRGINKLAGDLESLIETRITDEKEKKNLEYKVLQNQINPHFLYNTLNSIKWMASVQGADGIADMTTSLSRLLRSISKGTRLIIPLKEELSLVQDYYNIQNYRYGGTIQMKIECPEEDLLSCSILKFTLQPIVENAIFHGLEPKGNQGLVKISVATKPDTDEKDMEIIIWDNGIGMSQDKIDSLLTHSESNSEFFKELGISNVHKRLQYEYGTQYGIHIESTPGEYTAMHIVIPKMNEGD